jgi:hypothetical protein
MISKPLVAAFLAAGCVGAAAGGAYVAVRHNAINSTPVPAVSTAAATADAAPVKAVSESEALVAPPAVPAPAGPVERTTVEPQQPRRRSASSARQTAGAPRPDRDVPIVADSRRRVPPVPERTASPEQPVPSPTGTVPSSTQISPSEPVAVSAPVVADTPVAPPAPEFVQVVIPASSVIGLHVETSLSSERARIEDRVEARVTRDVSEAGRVAIPAGTRAVGSVIMVERGGKLKERARLGIRFHTLVFADGTELPISTDAIFREGEAPGSESAKKIGGATVGGAILGAILGGGKGAAIGGAAGAAGGTAAVMAGGRNAASLSAGTIVTVRLTEPVTVDVEKRDQER